MWTESYLAAPTPVMSQLWNLCRLLPLKLQISGMEWGNPEWLQGYYKKKKTALIQTDLIFQIMTPKMRFEIMRLISQTHDSWSLNSRDFNLCSEKVEVHTGQFWFQ